MIKKRTYIILLIILGVFFITMFMLYGRKEIKKAGYASIVIMGDNSVWKYVDKKFYKITYKSSLQKLSWNKYDVYLNNKFVDKYYLWFNDGWYVFDDDKNPIQIDDTFIALSSNYGLKLIDFKENEVDDMTYVNRVLEENNLGISSQFTSIYKVSFDINKDFKNSDFYIISNAFARDFTPEKTFSIAFAVRDDRIYYIYKDISNYRGINGCKPYYNALLDIDGDDENEFILSCARYSDSGQVDMVYKYVNDEFKIIISNQ